MHPLPQTRNFRTSELQNMRQTSFVNKIGRAGREGGAQGGGGAKRSIRCQTSRCALPFILDGVLGSTSSLKTDITQTYVGPMDSIAWGRRIWLHPFNRSRSHVSLQVLVLCILMKCLPYRSIAHGLSSATNACHPSRDVNHSRGADVTWLALLKISNFLSVGRPFSDGMELLYPLPLRF